MRMILLSVMGEVQPVKDSFVVWTDVHTRNWLPCNVCSQGKMVLWCAARSGASDFKTSVVFSVPEGPGQLFKALSVFALRELDMSKVESRPMRSNPIQLADSAGKDLRTLLTSRKAASNRCN